MLDARTLMKRPVSGPMAPSNPFRRRGHLEPLREACFARPASAHDIHPKHR